VSDDPAYFPGCHCHGTAAANCTMVLSFDEHDTPCLDLCALSMISNQTVHRSF
jgi:hypothetical protein